MAYSQTLLKKLSAFQYRNLTMQTCHMIMSNLLCASECVEWEVVMEYGMEYGMEYEMAMNVHSYS